MDVLYKAVMSASACFLVMGLYRIGDQLRRIADLLAKEGKDGK